ncbi:nitrous oxide reductase family maturation protein NosD [Pseudomonadota bacterium]
MITLFYPRHQTPRFNNDTLTSSYLNKLVGVISFLLLFFAATILPRSLTAADLQIPSEQFLTIQAAITAAASGDSLHIAPGIFQENILIDKPLFLRGAPDNKSIIDGSGKGKVITITSPNVHVSGLTVRHSGDIIEDSDACIYVTKKAANVKLDGNSLNQCAFGIWVNGSDSPIVTNNIVTGYQKRFLSDRGNGIHIWNIQNGLVKGNRVFGVRDGIYLSNTGTSSIEDNVMDDVRFGIHYMYNDNNRVTGNTTCNSMVGQAMMFSKRLVISNNAVINNRDHGLMLRAIYDSKIEGNIAYGNNKGIFSNDSDFNEITNNWVENNAIGINVMASGEDTKVIGNNFIANPVQVLFSWRYSLYWHNEKKGNYWSDYLGWDYDSDGIGDKIYYASNQMDTLMHRHPKMRLLALSPVIQLLQALETRFPVLRSASVIDKKPVMRPTLPMPSQIAAPEKACL